MKNKLMTHLVGGYPNYDESQKLFDLLLEFSKYIEVQFPFSDPIADGPVISKANEIALKNGATVEKGFDFLEKNIEKTDVDILIMTYYNIVFNYGIEKFVQKAKEIGVYGLIIPDIPFDEADGQILVDTCDKYKMNLIQILSPNIDKDRLKHISSISSGFVYAVSQIMTTGNEIKFGEEFDSYIKQIKEYIDIPIGVGFGIKTGDDIEKVCNKVDFAIIGSEILKIYNEKGISEIKKYLEKILKN